MNMKKYIFALLALCGLAHAQTIPPYVIRPTATCTASISYLTAGVAATCTPAADASHNGYLTSTDWSTFNSKGSGTVTTTGSPASGNIAKFSGATSITNGDLSGDCTTSGTLVTTCLKTNGTNFGTAATQNTGTSGATIPLLNGANTWSGVQSINSGDLALKGATSGTITINAAATAGTNTLTLPAGTTDLSSTGGTSQVLKQTSSGGAITVARLACADLSDAGSDCSNGVLTTKGDLSGYSSTYARVPVGSNGQSLLGDSTQTLGLGYYNNSMPLQFGLHDYDDLVQGLASAGQGGKISCNGVTGGFVGNAFAAGHPGVQQLSTGTLSGGDTRCGMAFTGTASGSSGMLRMGDGSFEASIIFKIDTLSSSSVRYLLVSGLGDVNTPAIYTGDLIALVYSDNIDSGIFVLDVVTAGTAVVTNGVTTAAADWYAARFVINSAYTQVDLYTRDLTTQAAEVHEATYTGTAGSTLPATTVGFGLIHDILNENNATSRTTSLDAMGYHYLLNGRR
jgi:hypothetical protein